MRLNAIFKAAIYTLVLASCLTVAGCGSDGDGSGGSTQAVYRLTIVNLTQNQPFSPPAIVAHLSGYTGWTLGQSITAGLELLAEGGDVSGFLDEADANDDTVHTMSGDVPIGPGAQQTFDITLAFNIDYLLTIATMLVNTNDCYTGLDAVGIGQLVVGEKLSIYTASYDPGTEANTETAATIPGPAAGGEGFNPVRDDGDILRMHPGVVSMDDGLGASALDESHRFLNPVALIIVERIS